MQKIGNMGSLETFAALVISDRFGKHRHSLRGERTGKTRTFLPFADGGGVSTIAMPVASLVDSLPQRAIRRLI